MRCRSIHLAGLGLALVLLPCCTTSPRSVTGAGEAADASARADVGDPSACTVPRVQSVSEECCLAFGIDACGAGLFCAAFDGRTLATCYALGSRLAGQECTADEHCATGTCGPSGHCAATPGQPCTAADGCATVGTMHYLCIEGSCARTTGEVGSACLAASDCNAPYCVMSRCTSGQVGADCGADPDCASAICYAAHCSAGDTSSQCDTSADCADGLECPPSGIVRMCRQAAPTSCTADAECPRGGCYMGMCVTHRFGGACDSMADCVPLSASGDLRCLNGTCLDPLMSGQPCTSGDQCASGFCYPDPDDVCA